LGEGTGLHGIASWAGIQHSIKGRFTEGDIPRAWTEHTEVFCLLEFASFFFMPGTERGNHHGSTGHGQKALMVGWLVGWCLSIYNDNDHGGIR
jgi:hypothetical protein